MSTDLTKIGADVDNFFRGTRRDLEPFLKHVNDSMAISLDIFNKTREDLDKKTIETRVNGAVKYKTHYTLTGDIVSDYPSEPPTSDEDLYWTDHLTKTRQYLTDRNDLIKHAMNLIPATVGVIISPLSQYNRIGDVMKLLMEQTATKQKGTNTG